MLTTPRFSPGKNKTKTPTTTTPHILIVSLSTGTWVGGQEIHSFLHYTMLPARGIPATLLVSPTSQLCQLLQQHGYDFYTIPPMVARVQRIRFLYHWFVRRCIRTICQQENIQIIHCNNRHEVKDALWVKNKHSRSHPSIRFAPQITQGERGERNPFVVSVRRSHCEDGCIEPYERQTVRPLVFFTRHIPEPFRVRECAGVDGVIGVSQHIVDYLQHENTTRKLAIPVITYIPPLFDATKFLSFTPQLSREEFFKQQFGINIDNQTPLICTIANFYANTLHHKNHPLLLQALHIVIVQHHKPVHALLAGNIDAAAQEFFTRMATELGITPYIHFLGFTDQTPALLHYTDMMVLPSRHEGFGICYMEAGLSKRPAIGATGTGAEMVLKHEETGLLFKNNDAESLAQAIERLLDNPAFAQQLGDNAYEHIMEHFSPEAGIERYLKLYKS